ncbi:MAG TPA: cytochrome c [Cyclobacteriaceae bacterium]
MTFFSCSTKKESEKSGPSVEFYSTGNAVKGKELFTTCATCHGNKGQGNIQFHAPALVNNESWYLFRQLTNFRNEIRGSSPSDTLGMQMALIAKTLPDSNAVADVIAYIRSLPATPPPVALTGDIKKGERIYQSICGSCHGQGGKGNKMMNAPRLSGLHDWYLRSQILKFRSLVRGNHPKDTYGAQMIPMVATLRDGASIDDVVAYILSTNSDSTQTR